jgi:hypothetical protein
MNAWIKRTLQFTCYAALACSFAATGDEDDDAKSAAPSTVPTLNSEQQRAVDVRVAHPLAAKAPQRSPAFGMVLDSTTLLADEGERSAASAQEHAASAEASRLSGLYAAGAGASLKMLEAAQAEEARAHADARLASARFAQHWGPVAAQRPIVRRQLLDALVAGRSILIRADLPGRHMVGTIPDKALVDVDGIEVPGRVLGALGQLSEVQSAGLLIEVHNPPAGLAAGARMPLSLLSTEQAGMLLPRDAVLYDENGAYVYKQLTAKTPAERTRYAAVRVTLLLPYGDGWLVRGVDDDDDIVVHGAGVLWSLEGVGAHPVDDDED